jgi:two-component system CheB/CheR fusion protein
MVLPAEDMAAKLIDYFDTADQLSRISALLRERTGHDFTGYKDNTIKRRIERRMQVLQNK